MKKPFVQVIVLIAAGFVLAIVSNAVAGRERRLVLPGYYPNARQVPQKVETPPATTTTVAPSVTPTVTATTATSAPAVTETVKPAPAIAKTTTTAAKPAPAVTAPAIDVAKFQPHPDKAYIEVSGDEAAALHAAGALTLDARRSSVYEQGHIAGARSYSVWESDIDDKVNKLYEERGDPREQLKPILIYCSGGDCEDSHMLAQKLWGVQFNNVYVYKDGYPDWQKRRGAIRTGTNP